MGTGLNVERTPVLDTLAACANCDMGIGTGY